MKLCVILLSTILSLPSVSQKVISIDTENTQLILQVDKKGIVRTMHYGENVGDPSQFLYYYTGRGNDYGDGPMTYPTVGGGFNGQPALHVKYADGN